MNALLDTHTFLWFAWDDPRLSRPARQIIEDRSNLLYVSLASTWEMAIKVSIGKLRLSQPLSVFVPTQLRINQFEVLRIEMSHTLAVSTLPLHHRDPFDRLLIAQALTESIPILSAASLFDQYPVERLW